MASPFMCMNVASGSVDAVSLFGICLSEELFLCRFQQVVNVCNVVIVLEEIGEFVQCLALLRSNILKFGVRNSLEASGNELVLLLLDEYFRVVVIAEIKLELFDAVQEYRTLSKTIILETHDIVKKIKTKDILYIENRRYGALLVTKDAEYATGVRLKDWIAKTGQPDCFVYSHASYIVNLQNVIDFSKDSVTLRKGDGETVSVYMSQRKYPAFRKAFFNFAGDI